MNCGSVISAMIGNVPLHTGHTARPPQAWFFLGQKGKKSFDSGLKERWAVQRRIIGLLI